MINPNQQASNKAMFYFCIFSVIVALSLTGMPRPAAAAAFFNSLVPGAGINFYEDVDREVIVDVDGSGSLTTGDVFIGWARIDDRSLPLPGIHFAPEEIYVVFSNVVTNDPIGDRVDNGDSTFDYTISLGPTNTGGLDLGSLIGAPVPDGSILALYEAVGTNLVTTSPGDFDGDGSFTILDFTGKIAAADLDAVAGFRDSDDHWVATFDNVPAAADAIADLSVLEEATLAGGIPGRDNFHAGLSVLVNNHPTFSFGKYVQDTVEFPDITLHELTVQNGDVSGASDLVYPQGNPFFGEITVDSGDYTVYGVSSNADFGVLPFIPDQPPGACRMTGGNATVYPITGIDGQDTWSYQFEGPEDGEKVTTGGQINAPSGNTPVSGNWEHTLHGGQDGSFSFHAGTASAPRGTEISSVECADPGWCVQARCAPFKQLFWKGIGYFQNQRFDYDFGDCPVVLKKGNTQPSLHAVESMIGDFGENDRPTRVDSLLDANPETCDWFDKLQAAGYPGPVGPYDAADAVLLDSAPDEHFGYKGGQVCDKCPDYYQIRIHCTADLSSEVIYEFAGYLGGSNPGGGNYQIHPETGEQCPVTEELVPELFESTTSSPRKGKKK